MTVKEYLHQAYRLDQRIKSDTIEAQNLREMAGSVSAIQYDKDRVQTSIHGLTWEQIGIELCADSRTIRRWHGKALLHVTLPDDPIVI